MAADASRILNRLRLDELLDERGGQPGTRGLLHLISADPAETRSVNERRLMAISSSLSPIGGSCTLPAIKSGCMSGRPVAGWSR